jgi:hypothetical protein
MAAQAEDKGEGAEMNITEDERETENVSSRLE